MTQNALLFNENQGVARLTLNRPEKRNAFDAALIQQLIHFLQQANDSPSIRSIVIQANGDHFSAGADIHWMQQASGYTFAENLEDAKALAKLMQLLYDSHKPTLALVQGSVYGGAIGLVAACDIVLATASTRFCFSEVKLGLVPAVIGPYVIQAIGQRAALRYMLTAETFDENKALALGLIHEIVDEKNREQELENLLQKLHANGPKALQECKQMSRYLSRDNAPTDYLDYTSELIARLRSMSEAQEGFAAFFEKRKPTW